MSNVVAGWYPDPSNPSQQRWWDGYAWAEARQPAPKLDIPTNTPWIWLIVLLPLVTLPLVFLLDFRGYMEGIVYAEMTGDYRAAMGAMTTYIMQTLWISAVGLVVWGVCILFAWLDRRELARRGIPQPFGWYWAFLNTGVYIIGRGVVLRRRTGTGLGPVWAWIGVIAASFVVAMIYVGIVMSQMVELFGQLAPYGYR